MELASFSRLFNFSSRNSLKYPKNMKIIWVPSLLLGLCLVIRSATVEKTTNESSKTTKDKSGNVVVEAHKKVVSNDGENTVEQQSHEKKEIHPDNPTKQEQQLQTNEQQQKPKQTPAKPAETMEQKPSSEPNAKSNEPSQSHSVLHEIQLNLRIDSAGTAELGQKRKNTEAVPVPAAEQQVSSQEPPKKKKKTWKVSAF